jgi:uncharacterized protein YecA (UPF0149 family)
MDAIDYETVHRIFRVQVVAPPTPQAQTSTTTSAAVLEAEPVSQPAQAVAANAPARSTTSRQQPVSNQKIGRNDPCPCGSGLKYKKCGLINSKTHQDSLAKVKGLDVQ